VFLFRKDNRLLNDGSKLLGTIRLNQAESVQPEKRAYEMSDTNGKTNTVMIRICVWPALFKPDSCGQNCTITDIDF